jgi:hypothetical protein
VSRPAAAASHTADSTPDHAWALARALSPHPRVRVADVDEHGAITNSYRSSTPASGPPPTPGLPYALHLADDRGRYRLLGFDLDVHKGPVAADLDRLRTLLKRAGLPHVVCASGPGGGRHVWVALAEPVGAVVVAGIARGLAGLLPSLDTAPLLNPRSGALRPPLAPHRLGGRSKTVDGRLGDLLRPVAGTVQVLTLAGLVDAQTTAEHPADALHTAHDTDGHLWLPGPRRALSAVTRGALHDPLPATADASTVLATALCGAVRAHWQLLDVLALLPTAPGLEHARTERANGRRRERPPAEQTNVLTRQWNRAAKTVASGPRAAADTAATDPTFEDRCALVVAAIAAVQRRADVSPGRWARGGGPADRRVLDVACHLMLTAVATDIELDTRRLALLAGIGRGTAHLALRRLTADGWLTPSTPAAGVNGARWAVPTATTDAERTTAEPSTHRVDPGRTQGTPSPPPAPARARSAWCSHLAHRISAVLHDALTAAGLGHHTARVYQALTATPVDVFDLVSTTGYDPHLLRRFLDRLAGYRLARTDRVGRWRLGGTAQSTSSRLDRAAHALRVQGVLAGRARRYRIEREAWAWWIDELTWRRLPAAQKRRIPGVGQTVIPLAGHETLSRHHRGPHPRTNNGRADFRAARRHLFGLPEAS